MEKNEVVAHVIMEQTADPCAVNIRDFNKNGMTYVIFETVFQSFGVKNRNKSNILLEALRSHISFW